VCCLNVANKTQLDQGKVVQIIIICSGTSFSFHIQCFTTFSKRACMFIKKYHGFLRKFDISSHISKHFTFCKDCFIYIVRKEILHSGTRLAYGHAQHVSRGRASPITQRLVASRNNNLINFMYTFLSVQPLLKESL